MRENVLVSNDPFIIEWAENYKGLEAKKVKDTNVRSLIASQEGLQTNPRLNQKSLFSFKQKSNYKGTDQKLVQSSFINEILTCNQWKLTLNIYSQLVKNDYLRLYDVYNKEYYIYSKMKQLYLPKCHKINKVNILREDGSLKLPYCSKDLPVSFIYRNKITKGFMNKDGIIHTNNEKILCDNLNEVVFIRSPSNANNYKQFNLDIDDFSFKFSDSYFYGNNITHVIYRNSFHLKLIKNYNNLSLDQIDFRDYTRNHYNNDNDEIEEHTVQLEAETEKADSKSYYIYTNGPNEVNMLYMKKVEKITLNKQDDDYIDEKTLIYMNVFLINCFSSIIFFIFYIAYSKLKEKLEMDETLYLRKQRMD
jgi:hypothetical protein